MLPISHKVMGLFLAWRISKKKREKVSLLDFRKKGRKKKRAFKF